MAGLSHLPSEPEPLGSVMLHFQYSAESSVTIFLSEKEQDWLAGHDTVTVGYTNDYLPYCDIDKDGKATGLVSDLIPDLFDAQYAANLIIHRIRIQRFCLEFQVSVLIEFQCQDTADLLGIHHTEDLQFFFCGRASKSGLK